MDHGKSNPEAGVHEKGTKGIAKHGYGYPLTIDSIEQSDPEAGSRPRGSSNTHGHSYPGRPYPGKGGAKNASPKPNKKSKNIVG